MGREAERHVREQCCVHGDGGGRVGEMSVQMAEIHTVVDDGFLHDVAALEQMLDPGVLLGCEREAGLMSLIAFQYRFGWRKSSRRLCQSSAGSPQIIEEGR